MKTRKNLLIAFVLNLCFSVFELFGGIFTSSVSIMSDAVHDMGDALSIGMSYFFEKKSAKAPDENYTYGYARYSVLGGVITTLVLIAGCSVVIVNAIIRMLNPVQVNYNGMIILAIVGVCVNLCAAYFTRGEASLNQKAVYLHMVEDVLGWLVVLMGAVVMKFTGFLLIDPIMSVLVAVYILYCAIKNIKVALDIFLLKTPSSFSVEKLKECVMEIDGVLDTHHIHIWTIDGNSVCATLHIVTDEDSHVIKEKIKTALSTQGVVHSTIEVERCDEHCDGHSCEIKATHTHSCCHQHKI